MVAILDGSGVDGGREAEYGTEDAASGELHRIRYNESMSMCVSY
jgi:hypothetical protein